VTADPDTPVFNKNPFVDIGALSDALQLTVTGVTIDGTSHLVQTERVNFLCQVSDTEVKVVTAQQVAWFLENGAWEENIIADPVNSISHLKLADAESQDDKDLALVQTQAVTLADLYRKGKKRGLISARSGY
jgi:hypothetical protein